MSRLDHTEVVLNLDGEPMKKNIGTEEDPQLRDLTFKDLATTALLNLSAGEQMSPDEKARCYDLAAKFSRRRKYVKLDIDEAALVKKRAGVIWSQLSYGRLCDWLEGRAQMAEFDDDEDDGDTEPKVSSNGSQPSDVLSPAPT